MPKTITTCIALLALLTLQACSLGSRPEKAAGMPSWVLNQAADSSDTIYGIGSGFSYNEAKQAALKDITEKLITKISSQSKTELSVHNNSSSRSANEQISTRTIETQLSDYKVLKSEQLGSELFMQISMSRKNFIKSTSSRLKELDDKIRNTMQELEKKPKLQQLIATQDLKPAITKARSLALLLQAAGDEQNIDKYLAYYGAASKKANDLIYNLRFNVSSNKKLRDFAKHITALLHNENISASISKSRDADALITISGDIKNTVMFSQHIAQLKISIKTSDKNNRVISITEYESSGASTNNSSSATASAIRNMGQKLKDIGILKSLGLIKNNS